MIEEALKGLGHGWFWTTFSCVVKMVTEASSKILGGTKSKYQLHNNEKCNFLLGLWDLLF